MNAYNISFLTDAGTVLVKVDAADDLRALYTAIYTAARDNILSHAIKIEMVEIRTA